MAENKTEYHDKPDKIVQQIPEAIEGAFIVILAQNAILFSKPIIEIEQGARLQIFHIIVLAICIVNFFNIAANWLSARKVKKYTPGHLFWDIITLVIFFLLAELLTDSYTKANDESLGHIFIITSIFYLLLGLVYIIWNKIDIKNLQETGKKSPESTKLIFIHKKSNIRNFISILFAVGLGVVSFFTKHLLLVSVVFVLWFINWVFVMTFYISEHNLWRWKE